MTGVLTRLRTSRRFVSRRPARKACRRYFAADKRVARALGRLRYNDSRTERAKLLHELAADLTVMADVHTTAFGPDSNVDEGGRDVAESIRSEAMLVTWLRLAEEGAVPVDVGEPVRTIPRELAGTIPSPDLPRRSRLVLDLADAMLPTLGGQAVEVLCTIIPPTSVGLNISPATPPRP